MADKRELILFMTGMGAAEPEQYLDKLLSGIGNYCDGKGIAFTQTESGEGSGRREIEIGGKPDTRHIDVQEIFWGDLRPVFTSESTFHKVLRGMTLMLYWLRIDKLWPVLCHNRFMLANTFVTAALLIAWYLSAVFAGFTAIGANPELWNTGVKLPQGVAAFFADLGKATGGWYPWVVVSALMALLPVKEVVNISYASKYYLQNRNNIYHKLCGRLGKALTEAIASQCYDHITLLSHSFGSVIATEVLANYDIDGIPRLRMITLGSPLLLVTARSPRVTDALNQALAKPGLAQWLDYYSKDDWLCTATPSGNAPACFTSHPISASVPIDEKLLGKSHDLYFDDWQVLAGVLA